MEIKHRGDIDPSTQSTTEIIMLLGIEIEDSIQRKKRICDILIYQQYGVLYYLDIHSHIVFQISIQSV